MVGAPANLTPAFERDGVRVPRLLYGTAWKEDATARLALLALRAGFRGIDTANQRKHYHEAAVGEGIVAAVRAGVLRREELFLQTKFTFQGGQDHRLPYDPKAPVAAQVEQSFVRSCEHLGAKAVDSYVLHGPSQASGLGRRDWEAWRAMEALHQAGKARMLGVSNVSAEQLTLLVRQARVPPSFVQNRCYASSGWDREVRLVCRTHGAVYQGFSLLTANRPVLEHAEVVAIAKRHARPASSIVFRFAIDVGMLPLTGTTDPSHMNDDLGVFDFALDPSEVLRIERLGPSG